MSDLISRQAVIGYLCTHCPDDAECFADCDDIKSIKDLPSVTPIERTGHWIMDRKSETRQCDKCMTVYRWSFNPHNYCPNCGCHMFEPQESEDKE